MTNITAYLADIADSLKIHSRHGLLRSYIEIVKYTLYSPHSINSPYGFSVIFATISILGQAPSLAQQNPKYLLLQFELFANKTRRNIAMSELAKNLTAEDRVNIALFYASQKLKAGEVYRPELVEKGKIIYIARCTMCHGKTGLGSDIMPRIAGQSGKYIANTLNKYKSGKIARPLSAMHAIAATLKDDDITALAAYLSALH